MPEPQLDCQDSPEQVEAVGGDMIVTPFDEEPLPSVDLLTQMVGGINGTPATLHFADGTSRRLTGAELAVYLKEQRRVIKSRRVNQGQGLNG
jgi:hypothetical protein